MTEKNEKKKKLNDEEFMRALENMEALEETIGMTDEQVAAEIRARGGDPEAVGRRAVELLEKLPGKKGPQRMAAGISRGQLEAEVAERVKKEKRVADALGGRELKELTLEELVGLLRM
jgi:hypothetical protein